MGSNATKIFRAIDFFAGFLALFVHDGDIDHDVAGLFINFHASSRRIRVFAHPSMVSLTRVLLIGDQNGLFDDDHEFIKRDFPLRFHELQNAQIDIHSSPLFDYQPEMARCSPQEYKGLAL